MLNRDELAGKCITRLELKVRDKPFRPWIIPLVMKITRK